MSTNLRATFQFLAKTENEAAVDVLIAGLNCPHQPSRDGSLRALLERRSAKGHQEVFRRLASFDEKAREVINERPDRLVGAASTGLQDADAKVCSTACEGILTLRLYEAMPALVTSLVDPEGKHRALLAETILKLTELFYGELSGVSDQPKRKQQEAVRNKITSALEDAVRKFHRHERMEVVEALLLVAKQKNVALRQMLQRTEDACHHAILEQLSTSSQGGVLRLLLGFLEDPQMPNVVAQVIGSRCDAKFVDHLLRTVGPRPSKIVRESLARFDSLAWADPEHPLFGSLGDAAQEGAVQVLLASSIDREEVREIIGSLLLSGKPGGRRAAAMALTQFAEPEATALIIKALNDEDPEVRAHLLVQLRPRRIPGALSMLIRMVDSTEEVVHKALRKAMPEFSYRQFLTNFDAMDDKLRPVAGHVVKKIDSEVVAKLTAETDGPSPVRRRRAVAAAGAMGLVHEMEQVIIKLLSDEDHMVRAAVAKVLADCKTMPTWEALRDALLDRSYIVQEAAEQSLERISRSLMLQVEEDEQEEGQVVDELAEEVTE